MQVDNGKIMMSNLDVSLLKSILRSILSEISMVNTSNEVDYSGRIEKDIDSLSEIEFPDWPEQEDDEELNSKIERLTERCNSLQRVNKQLIDKNRRLEELNIREFTIASLNDTSEYYKDLRKYCKELEDKLKKHEETE